MTICIQGAVAADIEEPFGFDPMVDNDKYYQPGVKFQRRSKFLRMKWHLILMGTVV